MPDQKRTLIMTSQRSGKYLKHIRILMERWALGDRIEIHSSTEYQELLELKDEMRDQLKRWNHITDPRRDHMTGKCYINTEKLLNKVDKKYPQPKIIMESADE